MNEQRDREKDEHYQLRLVARIVDLHEQLEALQRARLTNVGDVMRENEALRKDAERYRWLRSGQRTGLWMISAWLSGCGRYEPVPFENELDAAIDAARKETEK